MKKEFNIHGMSCNHCVARIEKGVMTLPGIQKVKVQLKKGKASVKYDENLVTPTEILNQIIEVGYQAEVL